MRERVYTEAEIRHAVAAWLYKTRPDAMGGDRELASAILAEVTPAEAAQYESEAVYYDATGNIYRFFPADFCDPGDPPVWNAIGEMHSVDFDVPVRPLVRAVPESDQASHDRVIRKLEDAIGQYDSPGCTQFGAYDVVGIVRDIVDGRDYS